MNAMLQRLTSSNAGRLPRSRRRRRSLTPGNTVTCGFGPNKVLALAQTCPLLVNVEQPVSWQWLRPDLVRLDADFEGLFSFRLEELDP